MKSKHEWQITTELKCKRKRELRKLAATVMTRLSRGLCFFDKAMK